MLFLLVGLDVACIPSLPLADRREWVSLVLSGVPGRILTSAIVQWCKYMLRPLAMTALRA